MTPTVKQSLTVQNAAHAHVPESAPLTWRVLDIVSRHVVGMTAGSIARRLLPWTARPYNTPAKRAVVLADRARHQKRAAVQVRRALNGLTRKGYLYPAGHPRMDALALDRFRERGWDAFLPLRHRVEGGDIVGRLPVVVDELGDTHRRRIALVLVRNPEGVPYPMLREMTGGSTPAGGERGLWRKAFQALVRDGVVVTGRHRMATLEGLRALGEYRR